MADATTIERSLFARGLHDHPLRVVALNAGEGGRRDVSEAIADKVREVAELEDRELNGKLVFIELYTEGCSGLARAFTQ